MIPQREYLCPAAGEHLSIGCSTNYAVLEWSVNFFGSKSYYTRSVSISSHKDHHYWLSSGYMAIKYSKISELGVIPLISTLHISNISDILNQVEINCTGLQSDINDYVGERISVTVLYVTNGKSKGILTHGFNQWWGQGGSFSLSLNFQASSPPKHLTLTKFSSIKS